MCKPRIKRWSLTLEVNFLIYYMYVPRAFQLSVFKSVTMLINVGRRLLLYVKHLCFTYLLLDLFPASANAATIRQTVRWIIWCVHAHRALKGFLQSCKTIPCSLHLTRYCSCFESLVGSINHVKDRIVTVQSSRPDLCRLEVYLLCVDFTNHYCRRITPSSLPMTILYGRLPPLLTNAATLRLPSYQTRPRPSRLSSQLWLQFPCNGFWMTSLSCLKIRICTPVLRYSYMAHYWMVGMLLYTIHQWKVYQGIWACQAKRYCDLKQKYENTTGGFFICTVYCANPGHISCIL